MRVLVSSLLVLATLSACQPTPADLPQVPEKLLAPGAGLAKAGRQVHFDARTGLPAFVWAAPEAQPADVARRSRLPVARVARDHLQRFAPAYRLTASEVEGATIASVHDVGQGPIIVRFRQQVDGVEVFGRELTLAMTQDRELVALSGHLSPAVDERLDDRVVLSAAEAVAAAWQQATGVAASFEVLGELEGGYQSVGLAAPVPGFALSSPARVKRVVYDDAKALQAAWYVEVSPQQQDSTGAAAYSFVIHAATGDELFRNDLVANHAFRYRVWADALPPFTPYDSPFGASVSPHPTGLPDGLAPTVVPQQLVTLSSSPFSRNDPWLAADATVTTGNNVDAYADLSAPDGYGSGDVRAGLTGVDEFDYPYVPGVLPSEENQIKAGVTQLFFLTNWLHDWFYDSGFDEAAGNAQQDNFGRGGVGGDRMRAEVQDHSGTNNANMQTPADGASPRMQMYLFQGHEASVTISAPVQQALVGKGSSTFGPQAFNVSGALVAGNPDNGCTALLNAAEVSGRIVLVDRGACDYSAKVLNAQNAGALGVVVANNLDTPVGGMGGTNGSVAIPALLIEKPDGAAVRALLQQGAVSLTLKRAALVRDSAVDTTIAAHEWGHYLSNRLVGNANGLTTNTARALGEGWSDFVSLLVMARAEDALVNADWHGTMAVAGYSTLTGDSAYFGLRRVPYSVDFTKNALTYGHTVDGAALPTGAPMVSSTHPNSQVHNQGEVWATMLWEGYVELLLAHPFSEAQSRMKNYLVASLKLTPGNPTFLQARDALLAAAYASDPDDYDRLGQAFARRGAGTGAVAPPSSQENNQGLVESFLWGNDLEIVSVTFDDASGACDLDGILDDGEKGTVTVTVRNIGAGPLEDATATVSSTIEGLSFPDGATLTFPTIPVLETASARMKVKLDDDAMRTEGQVTVTIDEAVFVEPRVVQASVTVRLNTDFDLESSMSDAFEAPVDGWLRTWDPELNESEWRLTREDGNGFFHVVDRPFATDVSLVTPPLVVGHDQPFGFSFRHRYDLERDGAYFYDGGVVEFSTDDGVTWTDLETVAALDYDGAIAVFTGSPNPLQGRRAFSGRNPSYPAFDQVTVAPMTAFAGQTIRIRFRLGTDAAVGATGWSVDDVAFTGLLNTAFATAIDDAGRCVNVAPVANAGQDRAVDERLVITLDGAASSDANGDALTYAWTQSGGPSVELLDAQTATPSFTAPEVTEDTVLTFELTVGDGVMSSQATVQITVRHVNRQPVIVAPDQVIDERAAVVLDASGSVDPDGDALTFAWQQTAGVEVILAGADTAQASFTSPEVTEDTELTFELTVGDGTLSSTQAVKVTVVNVNRAPTAQVRAVSPVKPGTWVRLEGSGHDIDGDTLAFTWRQTSGTTVALEGAAGAVATFLVPEVEDDETLTFELVVSDGDLEATATLSVDVIRSNTYPVAVAGPSQKVVGGAKVTLDGSASSDAEGDALTMWWTQTAGRTVTLEQLADGKATFTAPTPRADAVLEFRLTVRDERGAMVHDLMTVTVSGSGVAEEGGCATGGTSLGSLGALLALAMTLRRRSRSAA